MVGGRGRRRRPGPRRPPARRAVTCDDAPGSGICPGQGTGGRRAPVQKWTAGTDGGAVRAPPPAKCAGQRLAAASSQVRGLRGRRIDHRGTGRASTVTGGSLRTLCATLAGDRAAAGRSVTVAPAGRSVTGHDNGHGRGFRGKTATVAIVSAGCVQQPSASSVPSNKGKSQCSGGTFPDPVSKGYALLSFTDRTALRADGSPLLGPPSPAGCPAMRPTDPAPDRVGPALVAPRLSDAWLCWTRTRVCTPRGSGAPLPAVGTVRTGDRSVYVGLGGVATVSDAERGSQRTCTGI